MTPPPRFPAAPVLHTDDLILEPLRVQHAEEMAPLLDDEGLHTFIGGEPATLQQLRQVYGLQVRGRSPDGTELWRNWVLRRRDTQEAAGYVQATITMEEAVTVAEVAWVVGRQHQGRGLARQASTAMVQWLAASGAERIVALVHVDHAASAAIATALGLHRTATIVDGEVRWTSTDRLDPSPSPKS